VAPIPRRRPLYRIDFDWLAVVIHRLMKRKILVILSNRLSRFQKPKWLELDCDDKGNIHKQHPLRNEPRKALYDEVWENDEGKTEFASCYRFKRKYGHKLQRKKA
jgi:hypothetical protein